MNIVAKTVLLSALVFPGCGHLYLQKKLRASIFIIISMVCLYFMVSTALEIAQQLSDKIIRGEIPLDITKISQAVNTAVTSNSNRNLSYSGWILLVCWLLAIVDSYRLAKTHALR